jgi:hypothetical protein
MTIRQYIKKNGWRNECELVPDYRYMIVHINFLNKNKAEIETSLDIKAFDEHDLSSLFNNFCKENSFPRNTVTGVTVVASAVTMEELQEIDL